MTQVMEADLTDPGAPAARAAALHAFVTTAAAPAAQRAAQTSGPTEPRKQPDQPRRHTDRPSHQTGPSNITPHHYTQPQTPAASAHLAGHAKAPHAPSPRRGSSACGAIRRLPGTQGLQSTRQTSPTTFNEPSHKQMRVTPRGRLWLGWPASTALPTCSGRDPRRARPGGHSIKFRAGAQPARVARPAYGPLAMPGPNPNRTPAKAPPSGHGTTWRTTTPAQRHQSDTAVNFPQTTPIENPLDHGSDRPDSAVRPQPRR